MVKKDGMSVDEVRAKLEGKNQEERVSYFNKILKKDKLLSNKSKVSVYGVAASEYKKVGDDNKAEEAYVRQALALEGEGESADAIWEKTGRGPEFRAGVYAILGEFDKAAALYEKMNKPNKARELRELAKYSKE